jgi:hypothetical protein
VVGEVYLMYSKWQPVRLAESSDRFGVEFFRDLHTFDCKENLEREFARKVTRNAVIWLLKHRKIPYRMAIAGNLRA